MHSRLSCWASVAVCCLLVFSGCAETTYQVSRAIRRPFKQTYEEKHGIKTPRDRVQELRKLAKGARKMPSHEQEQVVAGLMQEFERENDGWVRREILKALAEYPQPAAGGVLVAALGDSDVETRRVACTGLGRRRDPVAVQELIRVVSSDTNDDVRLTAVRALGATGDKMALGTLSEALVDADPAMQAHAQEALVAVSGRDYGNNVEAWRELAQTGNTGASEVSFAEKVRRAFR